MHKIIVFFLMVFTQPLVASNNYSIVFIHIGDTLPTYAETALSQARLFNPECKIVLIAGKKALENNRLANSEKYIDCISTESLKKTDEHKRFIKSTGHDGLFWRYTIERFLYLNDYMQQYNESHVFHLENDNMLYADLSCLLPIFENEYEGIGATFDNDDRCIPGFVYVRSSKAMSFLAKFIAANAKNGFSDMLTLANFKKKYGKKYINNLPIITRLYVENEEMISPMNHSAKNPEDYCLNSELFDSIFDAAAIGQYLGGIDPIHANSDPGFINESCVFNPSFLNYEWIVDDQERRVPFACYGGEKYRLNNLHIHSKRLDQFSSKPGARVK